MPELIPAAPGSAVCRTCGFTDCPGANGGNCPRWPSRDDDGPDAYWPGGPGCLYTAGEGFDA